MPTETFLEPATRVAFVDCHAHSRGFAVDQSFRALPHQLRDHGIAASLVDLVRDQPLPGAAMAEVLDFLRELKPDTVVLSRAWDADLIAEVRSACPGTKVIRYSHGAPSAIDSFFDAVLDSEGICQALKGEGYGTTPAWRRSRTQMAARITIDYGQDFGLLPSISGPARGCPFLADARNSVVLRESGIDFDSVQSKGCSFCLDNVGAFAAFPAEEVVEAWLAQLRTIRRARPDVQAVLLTDERPHPFLPGLFRALVDEPDLQGLHILMKSRVDWLAEFADTAISEACEWARASSSVLYLYLVGFESFHQPDLDLFNKATTVADNETAIAILRALEARYPNSFECRGHRAHGIILFHPWTTPEALLENAAAMRRLNFHELRSQALRTRLRLYHSVPLHALAMKDGLLCEEFSPERGDRAVEQGYDASVPWRFRDPAVAAIYCATNALAEMLPELLEADLLELSTRFVLRWPCFATAPELAGFPIAEAVRSWGTSPSAVMAVVGAEIAVTDRELEGVLTQERGACLKEAVAQDRADALVRAYALMGLAAAVVSTHERGGDDGQHRQGDSHAIVAIAANRETLVSAVAHQRAVERGEKPSRVEAMGALLGYPDCCVSHYAENLAHDGNPDLERAALRAFPERALAPLLNRLNGVSLLSHFPCTPDCTASLAQARAALARCSAGNPDVVARITAYLGRTVLHLDYARAALLEGEWQAEGYRVRTLEPLTGAELGVEAATVRRLRLTADTVTFELTSGHMHTLEAAGPLLVQPGTVLAPMAKTALLVTAASPRGDRPSHDTRRPPRENVLSLLTPGIVAGEYTIARAQLADEAEVTVELASDSDAFAIGISPWDPSRPPALSRRGPWSLALLDNTEVSARRRAAIGAIAMLLPAGDQSSPRAMVKPAARSVGENDSVVCTAPWTTLEVVDPDGRVRQCCTDWTVGERGNLHEISLAGIWNGAGYRMARTIMAGKSLQSLCRPICPRLYDAKFAERELTVTRGTERFVENQRLLIADIAARRETVRGHPLYIAVCPSTYCNYDCIMCLHGRSPRRDLPESIWDELLTMLPTLRVLTLLGGEPLANPLAMKFLRHWDRRLYPDAAAAIVTNGSLLTPGVLAHLDACRFGSVTVSLNAGTADVYAQVQRGVPLNEVLANIDALIEHRRRQNDSFPIVLSFVVQPANHHTLIAFAQLARARRLPIRLMPLSPRGPEGLDFYGDGDEVARVLGSLDETIAWAERQAPDYLPELRATRAAIAAEAASRIPASHSQSFMAQL